MRHRKNINNLGRQKAHRKSLLSNMATSLILHKRIFTTIAKAKALRTFVEPLITKSKNDTTHSRRVVFSYLQDKNAVTELFRDVSVKVVDRPGGYTRILKTGLRMGDNSDMCFIELVDYNEALLETATQKEKKSRRRRGAKKTKIEEANLKTKVAEKSISEQPITGKTLPEKQQSAEKPISEQQLTGEAMIEDQKTEELISEQPVNEQAESEDITTEKPASGKTENNQEEKKE